MKGGERRRAAINASSTPLRRLYLACIPSDLAQKKSGSESGEARSSEGVKLAAHISINGGGMAALTRGHHSGAKAW